jgi:amino acid transporter
MMSPDLGGAMAERAVTTGTTTHSLQRGGVGFAGVLFQSVTFMAPAIATAISIVIAFNFVGGAGLLSVIFALVACLFAANSIGQLSRHMPSAGSFYTYVSNGLHPAIGFLVAWGFLLAILMGGPFLAIQMGFIVSTVMNSEFGTSLSLWWIWTVLVTLLVLGLGYRGIRTSTTVGALLGAFEILVFVGLSITLIIKAGGHNTGEVFTTKYANVKGYHGFSGVIAGSVYTILAFIGFEEAAPLAEEADNPRRAIPRAVLLSCLVIGLFYLLNTYAATVSYGPKHFSGFSTAGEGLAWLNLLARHGWGAVGFLVVFIALVNSVIANQNAANNSSTRTMFAMGRIRLLPAQFGRLNPFGSPMLALVAQLVFSLAVALVLGFHYDPYTGFLLTATILVDIFAPMYVLLNVACLLYFLRFRREEFNVIRHGLLPILGALAFIPAFFAGAGIPAFSFISSLPKPLSYAGPIAAIWLVIGVVYLVVLNLRSPDRILQTQRVFEED